MTTTTQMGTFYDQKKAASELRKYREKGPIPSTKALIDALVAESVEGATVLDIGGGIGAVQHELSPQGQRMSRASTPLRVIWRRHERRQAGVALEIASPIGTATSSSWLRRCLPRTSSRSIGSSTCTRTGKDLPSSRRCVRSGYSASSIRAIRASRGSSSPQ